MHRIRGLLIPLTLFFFVCSAQATSADTDPPEEALVRALLNGNWPRAVDYATELLKKEDSPVINATLAYALFRMGKKKSALERVRHRKDKVSLLTRAVIEGRGELKLHSLKRPVRGLDVVFVESRRDRIRMVSRAVKIRTLKQTFYKMLTEPTPEKIRLFREKVLSRMGNYVLAGELLYQTRESAVYMMFVDVKRLKEDVGLKARTHEFKIGVITRMGGDRYREEFVRELASYGYSVIDLGRGAPYRMQDKLKAVDVVVELTEDVHTGKQLLGGNFKEFEAEVEMTIYGVNPVRPLSSLKDRTRIVHMSDSLGKELAIEKSYGKLLDRFHTTLSSIKKELAPLNGGELPLKVKVRFKELFSSNYKYYARYPAGTITLKNTTQRPLKDVTVSIAVKRYMDYPTRINLGELPAGKTIKRALNMVFNSRILDITDSTFIQSEIKITYTDRGKQHAITLNSPIYVYEKHALVWDDKGKIASFITPRDPVIVEIATSAVSGYRDGGLNRNLLKARALFEAMGVIGISYMEDPSSPFSVVSGLKGVVDFVQFPRETITRKVGDCDDLTSLYASLLEAVGISTAVLDVPGHVFAMFDTGVPEEESIYFGFPPESYVVYNRTIWIPVETTLVGVSFTDAWNKGVENYRRWQKKARIIEYEKARTLYLAPNLPPLSLDLKVSRRDIEKRFPGELERLRKKRLQYVKKKLKGFGTVGLVKLIKFYAREGMLDDALKVARGIPGYKRNPAILNNMGNIYYLKRNYITAIEYYRMAHRLDRKDGNILVNIARAYMRAGNIRMAKHYFKEALKIDKDLKDKYITLYTEIND